ncbi:hypothetical protein G4B88_029623 [Cannabis sativa]|uniref:Uncharacterized protein n=1 Tax=Cannabis sativa TaxID=3483 RepID=A0A7J6FSI0_CANSA|nr:hypothetical protein G4B88_029623 [Cannabis sativa]
MCSGDRSRSVYFLSCHGRRRIGIQRQREGRQSRTDRDEKEGRSDGNFLGNVRESDDDISDSETDIGDIDKKLQHSECSSTDESDDKQSSEIPITTPSLPVSRVNYSTTTQPTESTQNEQEDLESTAPTKKRTRGQNRSKGTSKVVADTKSKLPVTARKGELHPAGDNASKLASEIGFIVRNHAPLKYKGWKNVPPEDKALIHTRIKDKFKIDPKEERHMHDVIERHCSNRYKNYRNQLHAHYKDVVKEGKDPLANRPLNHRMTDQDWHWLCDNIFGNPNWQSLVNDVGEIELFRNTHWNAENGWCNEEARTRYDRMVELRRQRQENNEEILEDEIRAEVLGSERCGHIPGLGPALNKKNSNHQVEKVIEDRVANMREEMRNEIRHEVRDEILQEVRNERQDFLQQLKDIMNIPNNHPIFGIQQPPPPPPPPPPSPPSFGPPRVDTTSVPSPPPAARVNSKFSLYIFICLTVTFSFSWFPSLILFLRSDQLRLNYAGPRLLEPSITITSDGNQAEGSAIVDDKKRENDDREAMEVGMGKIAISSDSKPVKDASSSVKPSMPAAATSSSYRWKSGCRELQKLILWKPNLGRKKTNTSETHLNSDIEDFHWAVRPLAIAFDTIVPDNDLKVGDVCAFVMTKNIGIILFEVIIFHNNGVANSPMAMLSIPAANKKSSTTPSKPKITPCAKIEPSFTSDYDKASMISEDLIAQKIIDEPSVN